MQHRVVWYISTNIFGETAPLGQGSSTYLPNYLAPPVHFNINGT
jgi:hypothetical protein